MNGQLVGRQAVTGQRSDCFGGDVGRRTPPSRMEQRDDARRVGDKHRNAVRYTNGQRDPLLRGDVPVCFRQRDP